MCRGGGCWLVKLKTGQFVCFFLFCYDLHTDERAVLPDGKFFFWLSYLLCHLNKFEENSKKKTFEIIL